MPGHKKNICWKHVESYILSERINSSQMPVLPQAHRADPCAPCCSLGSPAFPPGFSFFYINIFVCLLVFRHPQDIRRTARPGWSALLSSFLGPLSPSQFPPSPTETWRKFVHFANYSQTLSIQQRRWLILFPSEEKKMWHSLHCYTLIFFLMQRENLTLYSTQMLKFLVKWYFPPHFKTFSSMKMCTHTQFLRRV